MDYNSKEIKRIVESLIKEYFDDYTQMDDFIRYQNPYAADPKKLVDFNKFNTANVAKKVDLSNTLDIRHVFHKRILPTLEKIPHFFKYAKLDASKDDRVTIVIRANVKNANIEALFHFFITDKVIVRPEFRYFYDRNKLTPEQENNIEADSNVINLSASNQFIKVFYKPLETLRTKGEFSAPLDDSGKLLQHMIYLIGMVNSVANQIQKSELP